jgi:hypothetical protein
VITSLAFENSELPSGTLVTLLELFLWLSLAAALTENDARVSFVSSARAAAQDHVQ